MQQSPLARFLEGVSVIYFSAALCPCYAGRKPQVQQTPQVRQIEQVRQSAQIQQLAQIQQPPQRPAAPLSSSSAQANKPAGEPAGPQSTHFPILLLVEGKDLSWSLRIGQKGPERLDRVGYPPIPLDPGDVVREGTTDVWTYNAKDSQTGATVAVHLTREACTGNNPAMNYGFSATVEHAQIGTMQGCARVATELFPRINNQPSDDDDDDTKDKPAPPTVTHFQSPVAVAYVTDSGRMVVKRGSIARAVPGRAGNSLCLSHDGKKLLYSLDELPYPLRSINEYDFDTRRVTELIRANAYEAFWSPDDSRIAFLENVNGKWQIWSMPAGAPDKAAALYTGEVASLEGWADAHTLLAADAQALYWIGDDGTIRQTLPNADLYGTDQFSVTSGNTVRIHPLNPDLLLVSAELLPAAAAAISKEAATREAALKDAALKEAASRDAGNRLSSSKQAASKDAADKQAASKPSPDDRAFTQPGPAFFLYEIRARRRVVISPPSLPSANAEWSRDGLQIYFTGGDPATKAMNIYRVFWDGTSLVKVHEGHDYSIGQ